MNNGDHNIDKLFKDAFESEEHDFNAAYWQDAQQMLNTGKSTPIFTKPYMVVSALSIVISSILFFADSTPQQFIQTKKPIAENQTINSTEKQRISNTTSSNTDYSKNIQIGTEQNQTLDSKALTNEESKTNSTPSLIKNEQEANSKLESHLVNNTTEIAISERPRKITAQNTKTESKVAKGELTKSNISTSNIAQTAIVSSSIGTNNATNQNQLTLRETSNHTVMSNDTEQNVSQEHTVNQPHQDLQYKKTILNHDFKEQALGFMNTKSLVLSKQDNSLAIPSSDFEPLKSIHLPLTLRLSVGNYWSESFNTASSNVQTYGQNRNIEFSAEYLFRPNWGIQVGISYNNMVEEQAHRGLGVINNSYWNEVDNSYWKYQEQQITINDSTWWLGGWWHYAPYQDTVIDSTYISKHDQVYVTKYDTTAKNFKSEQKIKLIEVPVLISYNFNIERWTFQLASGMSFGFYSNSSGQIIRPGDPVRLENSSSSLFHNIQYNYLLQTELGYNITDQWQLTARPQMKMNLNSIYKNESGFRHRYLFYGVNVGVAYRF